MNVTFGFPSSSDTYRAQIPEGLPAEAEYTVPFSLGNIESELAWVSEETFAGFPLRLRTRATARSTVVEIYEYEADANIRAVCWRVGGGCLWTQVAPDAHGGDAGLQSIIQRISVRRDAHGIPRASNPDGALGLSVTQKPAEREQAAFVASSPAGPIWSVRFRNDGARTGDGKVSSDGATTVTQSTAFGLSVLCDGPSTAADSVERATAEVVGSLTRV
jgi:hypothetical protein